MGLDVYFKQNNQEVLYMRKAYFVRDFFNIRNCFDKKKVSKSQLEELISFMEKWRKCFDTNDFSSITGYPLWYDYGNNEEYIKELLDVFIPRFKELLTDYNKNLTVTADW